ncbi:hypothetical protein [Streptomyces sp. NPDC088812]|uniref:hypothetical protein n=1 Tax=Streptomyces sp. NPDC088812 TaxID=3365905 RepID=UPI003807DB63
MADRARWLHALAELTDRLSAAAEKGSASCPHCGENRLEYRYVVDPESRIGYVLLWCGACLHGISVSRVKAPEGVPVRSMYAPYPTQGVPPFTRPD